MLQLRSEPLMGWIPIVDSGPVSRMGNDRHLERRVKDLNLVAINKMLRGALLYQR